MANDITPPPGKMVDERLRPDHTVASFSELVVRTSPRYQANHPVKRGTLYSSLVGSDVNISAAYPALYFLREVAPLGFSDLRGIPSDQLVKWMWTTDDLAENSYNAKVDYSGDAVANPVYTRISTVRRKDYESTPTIALGTAFTGLISVNVTAGGTSYTTATGTIATGATVEFVIASGVITGGIVTNEGASVASGGSITITGDGTGATATAGIQPATAILVSQKKQELPDNDPLALEYVQILRVYEVLPGPYLPFTRYDENLGPIQGRRRAVVNTGQAAVITATSKKTYEARDGSSYVSWEIEEIWSDGTGSAGNPAYPILVKDFYDDERGSVQQKSQIVVATGSEVGSLVNTAGAITRVTYEPYADNPALLKKITETSGQTGPQLAGQDFDDVFGVVVQFTRQIVATASAGLSTLWRKINPLNKEQSVITDVNITALTTFLSTYSISWPGTANLDLPDTLTGLTGLFETGNHAGEYINDNAFGFATDHGQWSVNVRGEGSGGGQIMPDVRIDIRLTDARNVPTTHYVFFLPAPVTAAAFNTRLAALVGATVNAWPKFRPQIHTLTVVGRSLDLTANVDGYASESWDSNVLSYTSGHGSSRRSGMNIRTIKLPPTIHGSISISSNAQTLTLSDVEAHSIVGSAFPGLDEDVVLTGEQIAAGISPTSLSATAGTSVIPTTGIYRLNAPNSEPYKYGFVRCHAEVVDASDI